MERRGIGPLGGRKRNMEEANQDRRQQGDNIVWRRGAILGMTGSENEKKLQG